MPNPRAADRLDFLAQWPPRRAGGFALLRTTAFWGRSTLSWSAAHADAGDGVPHLAGLAFAYGFADRADAIVTDLEQRAKAGG
jgi:hypothetical protein